MQEVQILAWAHQKKENNLLSQLSALEFTFSGVSSTAVHCWPLSAQSSALCGALPHTLQILCFHGMQSALNQQVLSFEVPLPWKSWWMNEKMESKPPQAEQANPVLASRQTPAYVGTFRAMKLLEFSSFCYSESWTKSWQALTKKLRILDWESILLLLFLLLNQGLACTREFTKISFPK